MGQPVDLRDPSLYANRELSWLDFNDRVLAEAIDERNPLLERVNFLAITASNLDEFFAKRVGWLKRQERLDPFLTTVDGLTIAQQLELTIDRCQEMRLAMDRLWGATLRPMLADAGIHLVRFDAVEPEARRRLSDYFESSILPVLTPLVVDPAHPFPFLSSESLSIAAEVQDSKGRARFARVKVPPNRPRLIDAGDRHFVTLEDLITAHLGELFDGTTVSNPSLFRVIRSAEIGPPDEDADDLRELIENELERRRLADAVMIEALETLPEARTDMLLEQLELAPDDITWVQEFVGLADLSQLTSLSLDGGSFPGFTSSVPAPFEHLDPDEDPEELFATLRERDVLVFHPYESFDATVARFVEAASSDPKVLAIKQTLYRTSPDSPILESLIRAAGRGKQVSVVVELTARFDEANNIEWARKLEDAGVHIAYGSPALKVHSKISLIVREEPDGTRLYGHIGTGNYNSRTARVYSDLGLFTSDAAIGRDLIAIFNYLTGFSERLRTSTLITSPSNLRQAFEERIRREIDAAQAGRPARIVFKMNALEDARFTALLYEAAQAGVEIDLVVRGVCRLRPGVPGLSEGVRVVSVIGRFLEHARIYYFENGGRPELFIGSADLMKRNLDERIETMAPVRSPELGARLLAILEAQLADRRQGWELSDVEWHRDATAPGPGVHAQLIEGRGRAPGVLPAAAGASVSGD
ncbi:MAG: polyphosphate kinase 1 [Dehalococcoidia bacterium]